MTASEKRSSVFCLKHLRGSDGDTHVTMETSTNQREHAAAADELRVKAQRAEVTNARGDRHVCESASRAAASDWSR